MNKFAAAFVPRTLSPFGPRPQKTKAAADPGKKVLCKIEACPSIIQELHTFTNTAFGHDIAGPVEDEGPDPAKATQMQQDPATKRLKHTFNLG